MTGSLGPDGELVLRGVPTFLLGFYYETRERTVAQVAEGLDKMGQGGFNAVFSNPRLGEAEFKTLLQRAHDLGLVVLGEDEPFLGNLEKFAAHPALLGWCISDDAGDHATPDEIVAHHEQLKKRLPNHLTYLSISGWSKKIEENAWPADLIGVQCYPVDYPFNNATPGLPNPLSEAYFVFAQTAREAYWHKKPAIANVQAFDWGTDRSAVGKLGPAPLELRNMAWQAVAAGVKGILFYSYDTGNAGVRHDPALWEVCQQFATELLPLCSTLATHRPTVLPTGDREVIGVVWKTPMAMDILVVNTSKWNKKTITLRLPTEFKGDGKSLLGNLKRTANQLVGELLPLEIAHYRVIKP